ncbi:MAG: hypothetical protein KDH08_08795, partial [Anaerolineae bacterium]|nr:hypothetical protein [Anaerolineae bacterium]
VVKPTQPAIRASIAISPTAGTVGTSIVVTGTNWTPRDRIVITMVAADADTTEQPPVLARVRSDRSGRFSVTIVVPRDRNLLSQRLVWVVATSSTDRMTATAPFAIRQAGGGDVVPVDTPPPDSGIPPDSEPPTSSDG